MTTCREGCGACCEVICLGISQMDVRTLTVRLNDRDRRWVLEDLVPMKVREAHQAARGRPT